jgi:NAD-dependent dihydropyrimidine dehydrogenase PreA subunit
MPTITIEQSGCRACDLCVEICPTDVLEMDASNEVAKVVRADDCIGCTSCMYICPSRCLEVTDYLEQRPFHRIEENAAIISKFLQKSPATALLTEADYDEALRDISTRISALADTMAETVGRGQKALGRQAGQLAAAHLPELYESTSIEEALEKLNERFKNCFSFSPVVSDGGAKISLDFDGCALRGVVRRAGQTPGESTLCVMFHEYIAGLMGAFTKKRYQTEMVEVGEMCVMKLESRV